MREGGDLAKSAVEDTEGDREIPFQAYASTQATTNLPEEKVPYRVGKGVIGRRGTREKLGPDVRTSQAQFGIWGFKAW